MSRSCLGMLAILLVSFAWACSEDGKKKDNQEADGGPDGGGDYDPRFQEVVDAANSEIAALGAPGAAIAILEGGEVTFAMGFGSKHPNEDDPVDDETLFRIGSTTKMLTAVSLLQQVEAGGAALSDSLTDHLPDFEFSLNPAWAPSISLEDLLTHRHGMVDYLEINAASAYQNDDGLHDFLLDEFGTNTYIMAPAGLMWNYSNPGYYFAGLVAEELSGDYYREYLRAHVFDPLGMDRTFFLGEDVATDGNFAFGASTDYTSGLPSVEGPETYDNPWARPAGYAWSSVLDLAQFVGFLRDGDETVLGDDLRDEMMSAQVDMESFYDHDHYGYGLFVTEGFAVGNRFYESLRVVEHGGDITGYAANLYYFPDLDFGFVSLANADGAHLSDTLATALTTLCELPQDTNLPTWDPLPEELSAYEGTYNDPYNIGQVIITADGSDLEISLPDLDAYGYTYSSELIPYSPNNFAFIIEGSGQLLTFIFDHSSQEEAEYIRMRFSVSSRVPDTTFTKSSAASREEISRSLEAAKRSPRPALLPSLLKN